MGEYQRKEQEGEFHRQQERVQRENIQDYTASAERSIIGGMISTESWRWCTGSRKRERFGRPGKTGEALRGIAVVSGTAAGDGK